MNDPWNKINDRRLERASQQGLKPKHLLAVGAFLIWLVTIVAAIFFWPHWGKIVVLLATALCISYLQWKAWRTYD